MNKIIFATSNNGKFISLRTEMDTAGLNHIELEQRSLDLTEIQSVDISVISLAKAREAYKIVQQPVIVHDGGFAMDGLNGFPGAYTRDMIDIIGIETIAKIVGVLDSKACAFRNVATILFNENDYKQFYDSTGDLFTVTDQVWLEDHPKQWSSLWRILVPSKFGYTKPLAALNEDELADYLEKRREDSGSFSLKQCVEYLLQHEKQAA